MHNDDYSPDPQLPQMTIETEGGLIWPAFFILLVAVNLIFFYFASTALNQSSGGMVLIVIIPITLSLFLIDFISVFFYRKKHAQGKAKSLSNIILVSLIFVLALFSSIYMFLWLNIDYYFFPFDSLHISIVSAIFVTVFSIRFLRHKFFN
jgi:cation transport ATPase